MTNYADLIYICLPAYTHTSILYKYVGSCITQYYTTYIYTLSYLYAQ